MYLQVFLSILPVSVSSWLLGFLSRFINLPVCLFVCLLCLLLCLPDHMCLSVHYLSASLCLFVCLTVCPSVSLPTHKSVCPSVCLSVYLSVCLSPCLNGFLFVSRRLYRPPVCPYVSVCLSVCLITGLPLYIYMSVSLSVFCLTVCLPVGLPVHICVCLSISCLPVSSDSLCMFGCLSYLPVCLFVDPLRLYAGFSSRNKASAPFFLTNSSFQQVPYLLPFVR